MCGSLIFFLDMKMDVYFVDKVGDVIDICLQCECNAIASTSHLHSHVACWNEVNLSIS